MDQHRFRYDFYPVGQGLFCSGSIFNKGNEEPIFQWVYDCGTVTKDKDQLLARSISLLRHHCHTRKHIDVLTISHFDQDHINGMVELLEEFSVGLLLLPYMPLWRRLLIAFEQGITQTQVLWKFFVKPAEYISELEGTSVKNIGFVVPGRKQDKEFERVWLREESEGQDVEITFEVTNLKNTEEERSLSVDSAGGTTTFLPSSAQISINNCWEIVLHQDRKYAPRNVGKFRQQVKVHQNKIIDSAGSQNLGVEIDQLKGIYDKFIGTRGKQRNQISLFQYSGPIFGPLQQFTLFYGNTYAANPRDSHVRELVLREWAGMEKGRKVGVLYCGDGYLSNSRLLSSLKQDMGDARMKKIGILQVMHHGSRNNWYRGVAKDLNASISVFSSNPEAKNPGHPHKEVVRDFWQHCPLQVSQHLGAVFHGHIDRQ